MRCLLPLISTYFHSSIYRFSFHSAQTTKIGKQMTSTKSNETLYDSETTIQIKQKESESSDRNQYQILRDKFSLPIKRIVLVLCGSFNPITIGHLRMLELARDYYHFRSIQVLEGIISPVSNFYSKPGLAPGKDRIDMLREAIRNDRWLRLDTWEADQPSWTRTKLLLDHHHEEAKKRFGEDTEVRLLAGADVVRSMLNDTVWLPKDVDDIMTNYGVACITRLNPPQSSQGSSTLIDVTQGMPDLWKKHIELIEDWVVNDISATNIRNTLEKGGSVKYIVPDGAIKIILERGLYNSNKAVYLPDWPYEKKSTMIN